MGTIKRHHRDDDFTIRIVWLEWTDDDNAGTSAEAQAFKRVPASDWGAIFIISMESGLTWMRGNDPELR